MGHNICISRDIGVLRNHYTESHIKSSEWIVLSGDLGIHLVGEHLELHYRGVIQRLFKWMQDIMSFSHTKSGLLDLEREIYDILTQFEACFPKYMCSVNFHFFLHIVDYIRDFGPVYNTWNFSSERHLGRWKQFIKVMFSPYYIYIYCNLIFFYLNLVQQYDFSFFYFLFLFLYLRFLGFFCRFSFLFLSILFSRISMYSYSNLF